MQRKYVQTYESFSNYYGLVLEKLTNEIFDIPGILGLSAKLVLDSVEIITTSSKIFSFPLSELQEITEEDEMNLDPYFLKGLEDVYQDMVKTRFSNDLVYKLNSLKKAESFELFNVTENGFFSDINRDLEFFGGKPENIIEIRNNLHKLYDNNSTDGLNPTSVQILNKYLNSIVEFVAGKIYTFFKYIGQERLIMEPSPKWNQDETGTQVSESEKYFAFDGGLVRSEGDMHPKPKADYKKCLLDMALIINKAASIANVQVYEPLDYFTNREASATSIYVYFKVGGSEMIIKSILSPVEMKRLGYDSYVFWVENIDKSYSPGTELYTSEEIAKYLAI